MAFGEEIQVRTDHEDRVKPPAWMGHPIGQR